MVVVRRFRRVYLSLSRQRVVPCQSRLVALQKLEGKNGVETYDSEGVSRQDYSSAVYEVSRFIFDSSTTVGIHEH